MNSPNEVYKFLDLLPIKHGHVPVKHGSVYGHGGTSNMLQTSVEAVEARNPLENENGHNAIKIIATTIH